MKKNLKKYVGYLLFLAFCLCLHPMNVFAAGSITNLSYFRYANSIKTPAENTFIMHYGKESSIEKTTGKYENGNLLVDQTNPEASALIKRVGYYNGESINVKITLKVVDNEKGGRMSISHPESFLNITIEGKIYVTYEFQNHKGQPVPVKTSFTYGGLNQNKRIAYKNIWDMTHYLVANNPTDITYHSEGEWTYLENYHRQTWRHPTQAFQSITKKKSKIETIVQNLDSTPSSLMYETGFLAEPEFSGLIATNTIIDNAHQEVSLAAVQTMPDISNSHGARNLRLNFFLTDQSGNPQYKVKTFRVTTFSGKEVSDLFEGKLLDSNNYQLVAKNPNNNRLYDTVLNYQVVLTWSGSKDNPVDKELLENNYLKIPFSVLSTVDSEVKPDSSATTSVNYLGQVTVDYLNDKTKETLRPPETFSGIITDSFDVSDKYPEIDGYRPVKEKEDQGIYTPEPIKVTHFYEEGSLLNFSLIDLENPLKVSHLKRERKLKFHFSHNDGETVRLIAECGEERMVLNNFPNAKKDYTDEMKIKFPDNWIGKDVNFYIENDKGERSNVEIRHLILEEGVALFLPENLTFGMQSIPSFDRSVEALNQKEIHIKDESNLEDEKWTVKVKEEKPLTNKENYSLKNNIEFLTGEEKKNINTDDQIICQGNGNVTLSDVGKFRVIISPTDFVGNYNGALIWTLEQAPK